MISRGYAALPPCAGGQRIGLFGGSFNPPHAGHRLASLLALRRLRLDWVWWMVTPGNPLKDTTHLPPIAERIESARRLAAHPRIVVTGVEATLGSRYTCDTVASLRHRLPTERFVLLMGADSFAALHHWRHWHRILATIPLAIIDRPGHTLHATAAPAASASGMVRLPEAAAAELADRAPPAYVYLHGPRSGLSSTELRHAGGPATTIP